VYCKNCDRLIDDGERICPHCNASPRRRAVAKQRDLTTPKPAQASGMRSAAIAVAIIVIVALATISALTMFLIADTQYTRDEWHMETIPDIWMQVPDFSLYMSVTLTELLEIPQIYEGQLIRVMGEVVDWSVIIEERVHAVLLIIEEDGVQAAVRFDHVFEQALEILGINIDMFIEADALWFYGIFSGSYIEAHHFVPIV